VSAYDSHHERILIGFVVTIKDGEDVRAVRLEIKKILE
jgi:hypothetical protein